MHALPKQIASSLALLASLTAGPAAFAGPPAPPPPPDDESTTSAPEDATSSDQTARHGAAAAAAAAHQDEGISKLRYWVGGYLGTMYGFGIGHAIVGEYGSTGWFYTITDTMAVTATIITLVRVVENPDARPIDGYMALGAASTLMMLRIFQSHDLWTRPKVAGVQRASDTAFAVGPMGGDGGFGALLRWKW